MGWRIHKSVNLGLGFRINISKSGIGYSWGVPGYRKTVKANGGTRTTYSIPGTGVSYIEESNPGNLQSQKLPRANSMERYNLENSKEYAVVNGKIDAISTPENKVFVDKLKSILFKNLSTWIIAVALILALSFLSTVVPENIWNWIYLLIVGAIIGLAFFINSRRHILVEYNIDKDIALLVKQRENALSYIFSCDKIWSIESYENVTYSRVNAGASTNIKRKKVKFSYGKPPKYLKVANDLKFYQMLIGKTRYIFLPDKILFINSLQVGALKYHDIVVSLESLLFRETETPPQDGIFLYNTWQYVNNNGTPDRRFKNNRQIPVFSYGKIYLKSATGLNVHLMVSSSDKAEKFKNKWDDIQEIL